MINALSVEKFTIKLEKNNMRSEEFLVDYSSLLLYNISIENKYMR